MSTTLLVHPTSLSLTTLPRVGPSTPLPFPTRFPKGAEPRTAMSPAGHTYLWADSMPVVWEYDSRGRRVGEIKLTSSRERVKAVGCGEGVIIASTAGTGVWKRVEGKWTRTAELEAPDNVMSIECCGDITVLAGDEVYVYENGKRLHLSHDIPTPLSCLALTKAGLLYPSPHGITLQPLDSSELTTFTLPSPATHMSASKTDRAVICSGTSLHFLSLSTGDSTTVELPETLDSSTWIDGSNVAVRASGRLYLVTPEGDVSDAALDPVQNIHVLPPKRRPGSRASISTLPGSGILGESSAPNRPDRRVSDICHAAVAGEKEKEKEKRRMVSAPALPAIERLRTEGTGKERTPKATPKNARSPQSVRTGGTVRIQPLDPQATRMGAVIEETASVASSPAGSVASLASRRVSGDWAPRSNPPAHQQHSPQPSTSHPNQALDSPATITDSPNGHGADGVSVLAFEEMRREIANLQLDMLRMGRGLKNEIRAAVGPLVEEIRQNREVIAKQREEIERLRRGY